MLTIEALKLMTPGFIFASGIVNDPRLYKEIVMWVAVRGGIYDWAIYYHLATHDNDYVSRYGDKCFAEAVIRELVPCTDKAFAMYRF